MQFLQLFVCDLFLPMIPKILTSSDGFIIPCQSWEKGKWEIAIPDLWILSPDEMNLQHVYVNKKYRRNNLFPCL
jgi:hypothetical protein